jgi:hypothetical protein
MKSPLASAQAAVYEQYVRLTNTASDCGRELAKITDMNGMVPMMSHSGVTMPMGSQMQSNNQVNSQQMQSNQNLQQRPF